MAETDNPWKEALDKLYPLAMRFFLPEAARRVDWTRDHESLETNLRPFLPESQTSLRMVDKLVKVWLARTEEGETQEAGAQEEAYYHFEVQYRYEQDFEKRMSDYNDVARVHLHNHVVAVAILGDEDRRWRPQVYHWEKDGCALTFAFRAIKLLDWRGREGELLADDNPFALFVLAHLLIHPTRQDEEQRAGWKLRLWQRACEHKMEDQDWATLLRLIDWMLLLPPQRNRLFLQQFSEWRKEGSVAFVSIFEQVIAEHKQTIVENEKLLKAQEEQLQANVQQLQARDQQLQARDQQLQARDQQLRESCLQGIVLALKLKFQAEGQALLSEVQKQSDVAWLRRFLDSIEPAASIEDLRKLLP